jgi:predicted TPR repeat methyltransferase
MPPAFLSTQGSGDLLADRRYAYAEAALSEGDLAAAQDLFLQTLERVPHWLPARLGLGKACKALNRIDEAIAAFRAVAAGDEQDVLGARAHLAELDAEGGALTAGYVTALFDDYAPRFDAHLMEGLEYRAPEVLAAALQALAPDRAFRRGLDLGCGTGLMSKALHRPPATLLGVDLSPRMLEIATETGLYAALDAADCVTWLSEQANASADLILAADVFCYIENLAPVFAEAQRVLEANGLFAFTIQTSIEPGMRVGADLRVHHHPELIRELAAACGLALLFEEARSVRKDRGQPVPGAAFVLAR